LLAPRRLFTEYDPHHSGVVEGKEYHALINDVTDFLEGEFRKEGCGLCCSTL